VKKTYGAFWDSVHEFEYLLKSKGLGRHAKDVNRQYKNTVEKFFKFFHKMMDKLQ
jgi:CRISPR/Cas system CSM-associated protein Csm2 small subunit